MSFLPYPCREAGDFARSVGIQMEHEHVGIQMEHEHVGIQMEHEHVPEHRKAPSGWMGLLIYAGDHLISHTLTRAVPSAQRGLTSVFGMGTGVTLVVNSPANCRNLAHAISQN